MSTPRPLTGDPLQVLLRSDAWGTRRVLEACSGLTGAQFHARFDIGLGSLHDTLTHIIGAMRRWADRIDARPLRPSIEPRVAGDSIPTPIGRSPRELLEVLDEAAADLAAVAARHAAGLEQPIECVFGGKTYVFSRGAALVHVCTHGMYHRAQCINMLKRLGIRGLSDHLPEVAVTEWQAETETGQLAPWRPKTA